MEDDLKKRRKKKEDDLKKRRRKMEDDLKKRRRKKEDDLKKAISQFLLNLGANLSWGWLSSLRFL